MPLAASFAKAAFQTFQGSSGKPHSSITDWVEILTSDNHNEEDLDGIPEIVESIRLQAEGPTEASRAIRKKLKHGTTHQKYRALVILKALVENGDRTFQTTFADDRLIDAIRMLANDPSTDTRVKKKLMSVLGSWHRQFKDDPSMKSIANLYKTYKQDPRMDSAIVEGLLLTDPKELERQKEERRRKRREQEEALRKEKEERKRKEREKRERANRPRRPPFNFEKEKPEILTAIANASQASNNLINAITLVNVHQEKLEDNERVQECLAKLKLCRKPIVRYVQLVENEELIGTLIDTNDRIINALQVYDMACHQGDEPQEEAEREETRPEPSDEAPRGELNKLQHRQRLEIARSTSNRGISSMGSPTSPISPISPSGALHDLEGIEFGRLQAPLRPSDPDSGRDDGAYARGTLSDYSDYDSDDDRARDPPRSDTSSANVPGPSTKRQSLPATTGKAAYGDLIGDEDDLYSEPKRGLLSDEEDPFADPFADSHASKR